MSTKITRIEIKRLWGQFDINWRLNEDVNILSGINGSGKSTLLDCIASPFFDKDYSKFLHKRLKELKIYTTDKDFFHFEGFKQSIKKLKELSKKNKSDKIYNDLIIDVLKKVKIEENNTGQKVDSIDFIFSVENELKKLKGNVQIDVISTFDNAIHFEEETFDENVQTELDRELYLLQRKYLDLQLDLAKFFQNTLINKQSFEPALFEEKYRTINLFKMYVNELLEPSGKELDNSNNQISFTSTRTSTRIDLYQLSSGEKQLLLILLTFLMQKNMPSIVFMDEPEISLHFDWQKRLIKMLRELNPNAQIIIATHSPAMVMDGWLDKVTNIEDIKTYLT